MGECPHAIAPVLKYKARVVKRTIPWKYSTYLSMEAKDSGQDHFLLKGEGWMRAYTLSGYGIPLYQDLNAASAPVVGTGKEKG